MILHENLQDSIEGKKNVIRFYDKIRRNLIEQLDFVIDKEPEELTDVQRLAMAIVAGCQIEVKMDQNTFVIKTKNKIGVRKINDKFEIVESE